MQQFRPCHDALELLLSEFTNNKEAENQLNRAINRIAEQEKGRYEFEKMHTQAHKLPETNKTMAGGQAELLATMGQKLQRRPSLIPEINQLYHGPDKPVEVPEVDGCPVIDTAYTLLLERILQLNVFGCPLTTRDEHLMQLQGKNNLNELLDSCGIWPVASHINYSCIMNARHSFIGDMIIVRASQNIIVDTEIVFHKLQQWGFKCGCKLRESRAKTKNAIRNRRKKLISEAFKFSKSGKTGAMESILKNLQRTFAEPAFEVPRLEIVRLQRSLAEIYLSQKQAAKAAEFSIKALQSFGFVIKGGDIPHVTGVSLTVEKWGLVMDEVTELWIILLRTCRLVAPETEAYAKISYRICIGEDETFEKTYVGFDLNHSQGFLFGCFKSDNFM